MKNKRKSIAISNTAFTELQKHCPDCNWSPYLAEIILQTPIQPDLAQIPKPIYSSKGKRKLLQINYQAWLHLKKFEYSFIFEADRDDVPLNDIASLIVIANIRGKVKPEIIEKNETTI